MTSRYGLGCRHGQLLRWRSDTEGQCITWWPLPCFICQVERIEAEKLKAVGLRNKVAALEEVSSCGCLAEPEGAGLGGGCRRTVHNAVTLIQVQVQAN